MQNGDPLVYGAVQDFITRQERVNDLLLSRLDSLTSSPHYSGDRLCGVRVGSHSSSCENVDSLEEQALVDAGGVGEDHDDDNNEELGADDTDELVGQLVDYVSNLTLLS